MARPAKISEASVELATILLGKKTPKHLIKSLFAEKFGMSARTVERVLARAREKLRQHAGKSIDEFRLEALSLYEAIIADPKTEVRFRILAQERIDKLMGLQRPERIELSGPNGGEVQVKQKMDVSGLSVEKLKLLKAAAEIIHGNTTPN